MSVFPAEPFPPDAFPRQISQSWIALMIGNSRLHWALFLASRLQHTWHTPHLPPGAPPLIPLSSLPYSLPDPPYPLILASVVPSQTERWQPYIATYPGCFCLNLDHIPLKNLYSTLGIDRALALWGTAITYGLPALVIDAGTALTLTAANAAGALIGGAISPGLGLQLRSLNQQTAALPAVSRPTKNSLPRDSFPGDSLPDRWALNTEVAIQSGVIYFLLAGICDYVQAWLTQFPQGSIALTGGDGKFLFELLQSYAPAIAKQIIVDEHLIFWGMSGVTLLHPAMK